MRSIIIAILAIGCLGAAEFPVEGVHMCCGGCKKAIAAASPAATVQGKQVIVSAASADEANAALVALNKAGFHGAVAVKGVAFPTQQLSDAKADTVVVTGVHNCCGGCEKKITALVTGAGAAGCEIADGTVTATGPVSPKAVVEALNGGGLAATPTP